MPRYGTIGTDQPYLPSSGLAYPALPSPNDKPRQTTTNHDKDKGQIMGYDFQIENVPGEPGYHRLNIWGMGEVRDALYELGMLVDTPEPKFPSAPTVLEESDPAMIAYRDQSDAIVKAPYSDTPAGVPAYKLCSNDGWLVTPGEIDAALRHLKRLEENEPGTIDKLPDRVASFVGYMQRAIQSGFRVW